MNIKRISTILTCPDRNYLVVRIETENGIVGYGDATLNGRELAVQTLIERYLAPWLIGSDADRVADTWELVFRGTYWRGGPVMMTALAGIDMALWDIKGKRYGAPLYSLLGGKCRDRLRAYFHVHGRTKEELLERVRAQVAEGCTCVRYSFDFADAADTSLMYLQPHQDLSTGRRIEVGQESAVAVWDSAQYADALVEVTAYLRERLPAQVALIHDAHERFSAIEAANVAKRLEPCRLLFFEDPIEPTQVDALGMLRAHTVTPIGMGELYNTLQQCKPALEQRWIDYLRIDISHFGGVTPSVKAFAFAEQYGVKAAFHGPSDISPIAHGCMMHVDYTLPNFGVQETVALTQEAARVFQVDYRYAGGYLTVGDRPGHGVGVNEAEAAKHPYRKACLPWMRDKMGAVHDW